MQYMFFSITVLFHRHIRFAGQKGKDGHHYYFSLPLPPAHEHSGTSLKLCLWDNCHIFLIAQHVITKLLHDRICHFREFAFDWLLKFVFHCKIKQNKVNWYLMIILHFMLFHNGNIPDSCYLIHWELRPSYFMKKSKLNIKTFRYLVHVV